MCVCVVLSTLEVSGSLTAECLCTAGAYGAGYVRAGEGASEKWQRMKISVFPCSLTLIHCANLKHCMQGGWLVFSTNKQEHEVPQVHMSDHEIK